MNTDAHHSGKAHSTHDITGSPTTHGSYAHSHNTQHTISLGLQPHTAVMLTATNTQHTISLGLQPHTAVMLTTTNTQPG